MPGNEGAPAGNPPPDLITGMPPGAAPETTVQQPAQAPELITAPNELPVADPAFRPGERNPVLPEDVTSAMRQHAIGVEQVEYGPNVHGGPVNQ